MSLLKNNLRSFPSKWVSNFQSAKNNNIPKLHSWLYVATSEDGLTLHLVPVAKDLAMTSQSRGWMKRNRIIII